MAENETNSIQQFIDVLKAIPAGKKISFLLLATVVIGGFVALLLWANKPDYQVLFANLDSSDAARISEKLNEKQISFQLKEGGSAILVPDDMVYNLRLELASEGIPRGNNIGFEIFDEMRFGTTEFVQKLRYQQALQGELARTIMQFDAIDQARVHIVTSGDSLFAEPEKPASASVVIRLNSGRTLDERQLQGIINLVSAAVEGLEPENISVVDMAGGLLSRGHEKDDVGVLTNAQFEYQRKFERSLENRIQTMLEPIVGVNKVVARVSAELDFGQINIIEEKFDPDNVVVRSEQRNKESSVGGGGAPSGSPDLQGQILTGRNQSSSSSKTFAKENAVLNYEINKTNRQITNAVGDLRRLSTAVIIDGPYIAQKDDEGIESQKFVPRSRKEMKTFTDIVRKAIGYNETRGDQVSVSNIPFALQKEELPPLEKSPQWLVYSKKMTKPLFNIILIVLFFLLAIRPFRKWLSQTGEHIATKRLQAGEAVPQIGAESSIPEDAASRERLADVRQASPEVAADILRGWISET